MPRHRFSSAIAVCTLVALPFPALAGSGLHLQADGTFRLGYGAYSRGESAFLMSDGTLSLTFRNLPVSLELGVFGFANEADTPHETYGTVALTFDGYGTLRAGVPRPAYDLVLPSRLDGAFPLLSHDRIATTRSHATSTTMFGYALPWGVSWQGNGFAASAHLDSVFHTRIASLSYQTDLDALTIAGAVELVDARTGTTMNAKVGLDHQNGPIGLHGILFFPGSTSAPTSAELSTDWQIGSKTRIGALIHAPLEGTTDPVTGVFGHFDMSGHLGLDAGLASDGHDTYLSAATVWHF